MKHEMKRGIYYAKSYDGKIEKKYYNYACAYKFCQKLIDSDIMCGIYVWNEKSGKLECIIGC